MIKIMCIQFVWKAVHPVTTLMQVIFTVYIVNYSAPKGSGVVDNNGTPLLKMTGNQIKIYMALMYYSRTSNKIAASAPVLQELTDLSEKTIRKAISGLRDNGFLIVQRPDDPSEPTLYMLNPQVSSCCKVSLQKHKEFEFSQNTTHPRVCGL